MNLLNEKLKELRAEKKLTQKELANFLSVPIPTLSHWECGYAEPSCDDIITLCNFFNVSTDYLLGRSDDFGCVIASPTAPILSEEESNLLSLFHKMTHAQKVRFMAYGEGMVGIDVPKFNA